jgi:hypothetical protein
METVNLIGVIAIAIIQLGYILIQHFFYNKQIKDLNIALKNLEEQIKDKVSVIHELQTYITVPEETKE